MTKTKITIEQLHDVIDSCGRGAAMRGLFDKGLIEQMARNLLAAQEPVPANPAFWVHEATLSDAIGITRDKSIAATWTSEGLTVTSLYTAPPAPAVPPGYKRAPNEPTESMVIDGFESDAFLSLVGAVIEKKGWPYGCEEAAECVTGIFKAMIARIPAAPEVSQ